MNVSVVAAHPDDEILGCGASIAAHHAGGDRVHILILGEGITSRYARREDTPRAAIEALEECAKQSAKEVGAESIVFRRLPDNRFDTFPRLELIKHVEAYLAEVKPDLIYTHHPGDLNIDHRLTCEAVISATRPISGKLVREILCFEVFSSTEWAFAPMQPAFRPNIFIDIASTLDRKIRALEHYDKEARPFPHPRSAEAIRAGALRWGSVSGLAAAEAFELVRSIRILKKGQ